MQSTMNPEIMRLNENIITAGSFQKLINIPPNVSTNNIKITFKIIDDRNIKITFYYGYIFPLYIHNLPHDIVRTILSFSKEYVIIELNVFYDNNFPTYNHIIWANHINHNLVCETNQLEKNIKKIIDDHNIENDKLYIMNNVDSSNNYKFNLEKDILWLFFKIPLLV